MMDGANMGGGDLKPQTYAKPVDVGPVDVGEPEEIAKPEEVCAPGEFMCIPN